MRDKQHFLQFAFERVEAIERARSIAELVREYSYMAAFASFEKWGIATIPSNNKNFESCVYYHDWPEEWFDRYTERGYLGADPVVRKLRSTSMPFDWSVARYDRDNEPAAHSVMCEATEFGLNNGVIVPIFTLSGDMAAATFATRHGPFDARLMPMVHLVAIYAHAKLQSLMGGRPAADVKQPLSPRELEVMKWAATGLPTRDIADRLIISESTVETHINRACQKLDASNRVHAVALALRHRLIV